MYGETGPPSEVLVGKHISLPHTLQRNEVLVRMLAAPIHPGDINLIEGKYGIKPPLPAIAGSEGVGVVEDVGDDVTGLMPGDHVLPDLKDRSAGTWRTHLVASADELTKIDAKIPAVEAATMRINPGTAYRILHDFGVVPGDTVIQNGANSSVGQALIQIAKHMGVRTVNVIRKRHDMIKVVDHLVSLGADHVITDEELYLPGMEALWQKVAPPKLAVDCVAGRSGTGLLRHLTRYGTLVNYGGMSKKPLTVPVSALVFNAIQIRGFWMTQWKTRNPASATSEMMADIGAMILAGSLKAPLNEVTSISRFHGAVRRSTQPFMSRKQILIMDQTNNNFIHDEYDICV